MKYSFQNNSSRIRNLKNINIQKFENKKKEGLSIVILNLDKPEYLIPLVEILKKSKESFRKENIFFEILIGDTGSTDQKVIKAYEDSEIKVIKGLKYHFSKNNNDVAYKNSSGKWILFMNNDIIFQDEKLLFQLYLKAEENSNIGICGHVLLFENLTLQHCGIQFFKLNTSTNFMPYHIDGGKSLKEVHLPESQFFDATTGAFLMIKRDLFENVYGFNEDFEKEAQDIDLCLKIRRLGFQILVLNLGKVIHFENGTRVKGEESNFDRSLFVRLWSSFIEGIIVF